MKRDSVTLTLDEIRKLLHRHLVIVTTDDRQREIEIQMDWRERDKAIAMLDGGEGVL